MEIAGWSRKYDKSSIKSALFGTRQKIVRFIRLHSYRYPDSKDVKTEREHFKLVEQTHFQTLLLLNHKSSNLV